jgi:2-iminobutanoate/2-iminopropanoate deaminase
MRKDAVPVVDRAHPSYFVTDQLIAAFPAPRPARGFVAVSTLPYGATVEIEAIAHRNTSIDSGTVR